MRRRPGDVTTTTAAAAEINGIWWARNLKIEPISHQRESKEKRIYNKYLLNVQINKKDEKNFLYVFQHEKKICFRPAFNRAFDFGGFMCVCIWCVA